MNYPVWYLPEVGGGLLIAIIAVLHVFVSHFAVGGGLYLIYSEKKGLRENNQAILDFTKKHARFFLLLTMVFGSISGVGIWFIIALVNPAATSYLIHTFVFGWAAEWVFFVVEIAAAFVYFYMFGKMASDTHLKVGWLYFFSAWMSLLLINGIICYMLTPGSWLQSGNFWDGFFNPTFLPSLGFRTFVAFLLAGVYGYLSASFIKDDMTREAMIRFSAKWSLISLPAIIPFGLWYVAVLPEPAKQLVMGKSPTISTALQWGVAAILLLLGLSLSAGIIRPASRARPAALVSFLCALLVMGSFEWTREAARRPYAINEVMYSNMIMKDDVARIDSQGFMKQAVWVENREINEQTKAEAGKELFINQCYACHTLGGINNDLIPLTSRMSFSALNSYIRRIHQVRYFMPPFAGSEQEAEALAAYIVGSLHGKELQSSKGAAGEPGKGRGVFDNTCSACHEPADLSQPLEGLGRDEILDMLGKLDEISDEMEPFDGTPEEKSALAQYLSELNRESAQSDKAVPLPGARVFEEYCSACHESGELMSALQGKDAEDITELLGRLNELSEEMSPFEGTEEEASSLSAYLSGNDSESLRAKAESADGGQLLEENCLVCHASEDVGGHVAGWSRKEIREALDRLDQLVEEMPPYEGTTEEKDALADYLFNLGEEN